MTTVVNFFAGPGCGKSTIAADLFAEMKWNSMEAELVSEFAKDIVWEGHHNLFEDQFYISAMQNRRQERLVGKVDYVITDSPLMLCEVYLAETYPREILAAMRSVFDRYDNFNVVLTREKKYNPNGRNQDEAGARELDAKIRAMLEANNIPIHLEVAGNRLAKTIILEKLLERTDSGVRLRQPTNGSNESDNVPSERSSDEARDLFSCDASWATVSGIRVEIQPYPWDIQPTNPASIGGHHNA